MGEAKQAQAVQMLGLARRIATVWLHFLVMAVAAAAEGTMVYCRLDAGEVVVQESSCFGLLIHA